MSAAAADVCSFEPVQAPPPESAEPVHAGHLHSHEHAFGRSQCNGHAVTNLVNGHAKEHSHASHQYAEPDPNASYPVGMPPDAALEGLSVQSKTCLANLASYENVPAIDLGLARQAAVLITLFQRPGEEGLRVLLTTRARHLRRNPNQTALPGGKHDPTDPSAIFTARREAYEEVGLPAVHDSVYTVAVLDPVLTVLPKDAHAKNHIVVTPVVAFVADYSLIENLCPNPDEVDCIFDHPIGAIHTGTVDGPAGDDLAEAGGHWWPHEGEHYSTDDKEGSTGAYRMHRFRTRHSPIKGFTSDVLVTAVTIAFGEEPRYGRFAPGQKRMPQTISEVIAALPDALTQPETAPLEWVKALPKEAATSSSGYVGGDPKSEYYS